MEDLSEFPGVAIIYGVAGRSGRPRLSEIPLASILKRKINRSFTDWGQHISAVDVTLGYALRSAPPIPYDIDYTRTLGYGAVRFLLSEPDLSKPDGESLRKGGLICLQDGHLKVLPFDGLQDPATGQTRVRLVDTRSEHYAVACEYLIRLEPEDLEDQASSHQMASSINMTDQDFARYFAPVVAPRAMAVIS